MSSTSGYMGEKYFQEFGLKCVHMARYELILKLDGALWLTIIFKTSLTPGRAIKIQNRYLFFCRGGHHQEKTEPSVCGCAAN